MNVKVSVAQSCLTLCNPMDCNLPGSSVHGVFSGKEVGVGGHFLLQSQILLILKYRFEAKILCFCFCFFITVHPPNHVIQSVGSFFVWLCPRWEVLAVLYI